MFMRILARIVAVAVLLGFAHAADAQGNRRDREDPELVTNNGGRTGRCDDLRFTPDGKQLLAVGDDKVVRVWSVADGKLDPASRALRWSIWREQRGSIFALSVSPDGRRVAIGGYAGASTGVGTVAVLDIATGALLDTTHLDLDNGAVVWAAAFSPSGKRVAFGGGDGSVWVWDFHTLTRLGGQRGDRNFNSVRLLQFEGEGHLLSLAEDGRLLEWDATKAGDPTVVLDLAAKSSVFRAEISPDGRWLAAAVQGRGLVRLADLKTKTLTNITLKDREFARALAFDPKGDRLAVGVGLVPPGKGFHIEADDRIVFYDLGRKTPEAAPGPKNTYRADRLTFSPDGAFLAVAGGDNHEATVWDLAHPDKAASVVSGVGKSLWDVAVSEDGRAVGVRDQRDPASTDPNARAQGPWRVFDLPRRLWVPAADFKPVRRVATAGGWTVEPDATDPYVWRAVHESGAVNSLPLDRDRDGMPRCYTFLAAQGDGPVRLVVGHYWGLSVFELDRTAKSARRTRWCIGHQGEVTAVAPSADQTWLVSCSDDMTLAAWSLSNEWPSQPILGAKFSPDGAGLKVDAVDVGSPAWEAGLVAHDQVKRFAYAGKWMEKDNPAAWLDRLTRPTPGLEHAFDVVRDGRNVTQDGKAPLITTLKQRPIWRFFAAGDEWVLWMWRNSYYDSSASGDKYLGWHVNAADPHDGPTFFPLEHFSEHFRRPDVIKRLLKSRDPGEVLTSLADDLPPLHFDTIEPPAAALKLADAPPDQVVVAQPGKDVPAALSAWSRGDNPDEVPVRAELWINDYRLLVRKDVDDWPKTGQSHTLRTAIPYARLRAGDNVVTFQTWNRLGGRTDMSQTVTCERKASANPRLVGLAVGINDYGASKLGAGEKGVLDDLHEAVNDAEELSIAWKRQKLYGDASIAVLIDSDANRTNILAALDKLKNADPDDRCFIFLSGHGYGWTEAPEQPGGTPHSLFAFCLPGFDPAKPYSTGISSDVLFEKLAAIPCRKILFLDACHSGGAAAEDSPIRRFAPAGQGPIILAACDRTQRSFEDQALKHGLFTKAVLEAIGPELGKADTSGNGFLEVEELYNYVCDRMPELLKQIKNRESEQVPTLLAPQSEDYPIAKKAE